MIQKCSSFVYSAFERFFSLNDEEIPLIGNTIPLPQFPDEVIIGVIEETNFQLQKIPNMIEIESSNVVIAGDIHGNIVDLIRIIIQYQRSKASSLLFLGDYVDRGDFSIEVVTLLFSISNLFPGSIFLLRGNHEFVAVNKKYGFLDECNHYFNSDSNIFTLFNEAFNFLPLAALINKRVFCVHGGICEPFKHISQINKIEKGIETFDDEVVYGLMWADPCDTSPGFIESYRGAVAFGAISVRNFLERNNLTKIVRGHQMMPEGVGACANGHVITVFSCSNYGAATNLCGFATVIGTDDIFAHSLNCLLQRKRDEVRFTPYFPKKVEKISSCYAVMSKIGQYQCKNKRSLPNLSPKIFLGTQMCQKSSSICMKAKGDRANLLKNEMWMTAISSRKAVNPNMLSTRGIQDTF